MASDERELIDNTNGDGNSNNNNDDDKLQT